MSTRGKRKLFTLISVLCGALVVGLALAAVDEREDAIAPPRSASEVPEIVPDPTAAGNFGLQYADAGSELFRQVQALQQEARALRDLYERQEALIKDLRQEQVDRYLGFERRLTQAHREVAVRPPDGAGVADAVDEYQDYMSAFALVRENRLLEAIGAFVGFLFDYPDSQYNAYASYWLGELYLHAPTPDNEKSRQRYTQALAYFPDSDKTPDILYKLGIVNHRLGYLEEAQSYLERVRDGYPDTASAHLAEAYLQREFGSTPDLQPEEEGEEEFEFDFP